MMCRLVVGVIFSLGSIAFGGASIGGALNQTTASNVVQISGATVPTFYYSSITSTLDGTGVYYIGSNGGTCNTNINPRCITNASNPGFVIQAVDTVATSGSPTFYLVLANSTATPAAPATGGASVPINGFTTLVNWPYSQTNSTPLAWGTLCSDLMNAGLALDANCMQTPAGTNFEPVTATIYLIGDANGNGQLDPGESVLAFSIIFQSTIPANSSIADQIGFYQYQIFPGDSQCNVINSSADLSFNSTSENGGTGAQYLNFYYVTSSTYDVYSNPSTVPFGSITPDTTPNKPVQLTVASDGSLQPNNFLTGLTNGTNYYFRAAIVDNAGNIGYVTPASDDNPAGQALKGAPLITLAHACQPGPIAGLLSKNGECFVATAAYGSPMAKEVQTFRNFRDKYLMQSEMGRKFVGWYYRTGPYYADRIRNHDTLRAIVRGGLYPLLGFSWLALKIGANNACLLTVTLLLLPLLFFQYYRLRKRDEMYS